MFLKGLVLVGFFSFQKAYKRCALSMRIRGRHQVQLVKFGDRIEFVTSVLWWSRRLPFYGQHEVTLWQGPFAGVEPHQDLGLQYVAG
jgi:hypothetical protein